MTCSPPYPSPRPGPNNIMKQIYLREMANNFFKDENILSKVFCNFLKDSGIFSKVEYRQYEYTLGTEALKRHKSSDTRTYAVKCGTF